MITVQSCNNFYDKFFYNSIKTKNNDQFFDAIWNSLSSMRRCESKHRPNKVIRFRNLDKK